MKMFEGEDLLNLMDEQTIVCGVDGLYVNGCFYDWPRANLAKHNVKQIEGKLYVDGYVFTLKGWRRSLRSFYENLI